MRTWLRSLTALSLATVLSMATPAQPSAAQTYDCSDPDVQQALRYAWQYYQQLMALYRSADPTARAAMDRETRRLTGYTVTELIALFDRCGRQQQTRAPTARPTARPTAARSPAPTPGGPLSFGPPARLLDATAGRPYAASFAGLPRGGAPPYHFQLGTLGGFPPIGVILSPDGQLSGTPARATAGRTYTFQVCAVDVGGTAVCRPVALSVVAPAAPTPRVRTGQYSFAPSRATTAQPARYMAAPTPAPEAATIRARTGPLELVLPGRTPSALPSDASHLALGWQLFSRTDMSDEEAAALYFERTGQRIRTLEHDVRVAREEEAALARQADAFEASVATQQIERVVDALRDDHRYFSDVHSDQMMAAAVALTGVGPLGAAGDVVGGASFGKDSAELVARLGAKAATGERWTLGDSELAANALAGGVGVAATVARRTGVGESISWAQAGIAIAQAAYADRVLREIDLRILDASTSIEAQRRSLATRRETAAWVVRSLEEEMAWRQRDRETVDRLLGR